MEISQAGPDDVPGLARLIWRDTVHDLPDHQSLKAFTAELSLWWAAHHGSHRAFLARLGENEIVGMAWVALLPRVPRPGATSRLSADIQTVYVVPENRGAGIGSALVRTAVEHAVRLGASHATVHSGRRAVPIYERLGFASSRELLERPTERLRSPGH